MSRELAFYLKGRPNGGGANSVVQEFSTLVRHHGTGYLVVPEEHLSAFKFSYGWDDRLLARVCTSLKDLPEDVIPIATTNDSVQEVRDAWSDRGGTILYYVQDYEPLFYPPHTVQYKVARESYGQVNDVVAVVKTQWLKQVLLRETFLPVVEIDPSINRELFCPDPSRPATGRRTLLAMIRPATPRRAPQRTVAVVNRLVREMGDQVDVVVFGASSVELQSAGLALDERVHNAGRLTQSQVASLARMSHYFLDLSDYQAFGRGLAEGMACGAVPIATRWGAPPEFIRQGTSGWLVDPTDLEGAYQQVLEAMAVSSQEHEAMAESAKFSVGNWSLQRTAAEWLQVLTDVGGE